MLTLLLEARYYDRSVVEILYSNRICVAIALNYQREFWWFRPNFWLSS